ncbi:ABC transporter ATP-binding protein [Oceanotoga sp. DSM 15011]|jgi:putative ABC transport system ATP-binding protein|uniref:ABC transport system ATP-binding protein n=1 Tax=Oceanotoga teriensis TaxID=515440 RepID=A0AA45C4F4_9BACT|nr:MULTISPECIES: ABC transporter ATP-binding protein [Oceanotoga]MDO7977888.1 ABC transporter ATP-binding protein [Oceanotoga teriensis]PWJ84696.1 putative ABC transport system ATP-binding protein [Oceanotoga teriensis]UYO99617.1 ABC transporter ATP-binding protein [Oceanotoga sp. DSM 15011]
MVNAEGLTKVYKSKELEFRALDDVNISFDSGKIVSILGPSGSGKSTLLNCLSGIDKPTSGNVFIDEKNITTLKDDDLTEFRVKNMGFIFQFFNLIDVLNAVENVELPLLVLGKDKKESREKSLKLLDRVGILNKAYNFPSTLSGGEAQRVAIARALISEPKIVWADEPTGSLDSKNSFEIMSLIKELNEKNGQTFVIVTHDIRVSNFSHEIFKMDSGKIVAQELV